MKKIVFKPLIESTKSIPETFENLVYASPNDLHIQKKPAVWFTRNRDSVHYNQSNDTLEIGKKFIGHMLFRGSVEVTVPKKYLQSKKGIKVKFRGYGIFSVKVMESTVTKGGVRMYGEGTWQKLDTTREAETFTWSHRWQTRTIYFKNFYNKPLNVGLKPYLKGFKPLNVSKVTSLEIVGRVGMIEIKNLRIV